MTVDLAQLHKDLEGLERLQSLQSTLIGEIRRQIENIRAEEKLLREK